MRGERLRQPRLPGKRLAFERHSSEGTATVQSNHDIVFLKHFSMVIGALVCVAIGLILFANYLYGTAPHDSDPAKQAQVEARIAPVGAVYAGSTGKAAMAAAADAAKAAAGAQVAYGGTLDGSVIFGQLCTGCHSSGANGAPKLEKAAWAARLPQGEATLIKHAIDGYTGPDGNHMPAKGGNPALSDAQVEATVKWMVGQIK
ncbi:MAG: cytochrome c5 family protein [Proteobacteria bacterium]|nr:cytochrome c5 family protein [Pseudomonadota bacterium]MBS0464173.1 cytochrome c5 family protein [Pseudomonadota bacterium]